MTRLTLPFLYDYTFSNIVLPNALINEMAIINYIHSLYSNRIKNHSFFEENFLNGSSIDRLSKIFDYGLGHFPNSRGYKSHLQTGAYSHLLHCTEESLYFGKKMYKKYIYPILISPHFNEFTAVNITQFPKLNGEYFWKHMSAQALEDAKCGKAIVFLDYGQENFVEREDYHRLHESLRFSGIPKENIILAFNSFNSKQIYEDWFPEEQRMLEVHNWPVVVANTSYHFSEMIKRNDPSCVTEEEFNNSRNVLRENKFIFKVRRPRMHRMVLLFYMAEENLLEEGDWSCLSPIPYRQDEIDTVREYYKINFTDSTVQQLYNKIPHHLKTETSSDFSTVSAWSDTHSQFYKNAYLYICSETFAQVGGQYKSLTEKVFKPMINYLPFVFAAYPGALQLLKDLGFKTFHPFIDESYDQEQNEGKRINMLSLEIKRICSMTKEELHKWYWDMEPILQHNRLHATNWYKTDNTSFDFIKYLYNKITL